jgi:transcriptional regulator with XRE-family HTH domain
VAALPTLPNLIRDARHAAGLTQAELAERLQTTQSAVARLESPHANPRLGTIARAIAATGQELRVTVHPAPAPSVDETLIAANLRLDPAARLRRFSDGYVGVARLAGKVDVVRP